MTREDAIYEIKQLVVLSNEENIDRITEAFNMAIEALQDEIWKDEPCDKCVFVKGSGWCDNCNGKPKGLDALPNSRKAEQTEPQMGDAKPIPLSNRVTHIEDEPQTDTEIAKAIVHKMIDDAVIAEDAYPDLRQKMHDAVDEYEPQTDCSWK